MTKYFVAPLVVLGLVLASCQNASPETVDENQEPKIAETAKKKDPVVYKTERLIIRQLSPRVYVHTSYLQTDDFGRVACNGMIVIHKNEAVVFDTPIDAESSGDLIDFIGEDLEGLIVAVVPTHFHQDCVGGVERFNEQHIPVFVSARTSKLLEVNNLRFSKPLNEFYDSLSLKLGGLEVIAQYLGEGHTRDNIVGYFPADSMLFGGCLIKTVGANKGYLGDANILEWSNTVRRLKEKYPMVKTIIPGHGQWGGNELLDYTIELFE